jgi:hydroxymethylbilane synthase
MHTPDILRLGSRESPLALMQTNLVAQRLHKHWPDLKLEVKTFKTQGDLILDQSLSKVGDKGLFVKELEVALLEGHIDLAIHSMKDMPGDLPGGLTLTSVTEREDPRDVLLTRDHKRFSELPAGAIIGTSSLRREAQLRRIRPDLRYEVIRGNLQTRYHKLLDGPYQGIILAAAGIHRLNWQSRLAQYFDAWHETVPAVGQGILGAEFRNNDTRVANYLTPLQFQTVQVAQIAERAALQTLKAGCHAPLGVHCRPAANGYELKGILLSLDTRQIALSEMSFDGKNPELAGQQLAKALLHQGGRDILDAAQHQRTLVPTDKP